MTPRKLREGRRLEEDTAKTLDLARREGIDPFTRAYLGLWLRFYEREGHRLDSCPKALHEVAVAQPLDSWVRRTVLEQIVDEHWHPARPWLRRLFNPRTDPCPALSRVMDACQSVQRVKSVKLYGEPHVEIQTKWGGIEYRSLVTGKPAPFDVIGAQATEPGPRCAPRTLVLAGYCDGLVRVFEQRLDTTAPHNVLRQFAGGTTYEITANGRLIDQYPPDSGAVVRQPLPQVLRAIEEPTDPVIAAWEKLVFVASNHVVTDRLSMLATTGEASIASLASHPSRRAARSRPTALGWAGDLIQDTKAYLLHWFHVRPSLGFWCKEPDLRSVIGEAICQEIDALASVAEKLVILSSESSLECCLAKLNTLVLINDATRIVALKRAYAELKESVLQMLERKLLDKYNSDLRACHLAWTRDATFVVVGCSDGAVYVCRIASDQLFFSTFVGRHAKEVTAATVSDDHAIAASASADRMIYVWDTTRGARLVAYPCEVPIAHLALGVDDFLGEPVPLLVVELDNRQVNYFRIENLDSAAVAATRTEGNDPEDRAGHWHWDRA